MAQRNRNPSPRRLVDPYRSSTGMMPLYNTTLGVPQHHPTRASVSDVSSGSSRGSRGEAQLISKTTYRGEPGHNVPVSKTEYKVPIHQRRNTLEPDTSRPDTNRLDPNRVPLNVLIPSRLSNNRPPAVISADRERPRSPYGRSYRDPDSYLVPAASPRNHRRIFSADGENVSGLVPPDRERGHRAERHYRDHRPERRYPPGQLVPRSDYENEYSYTTPAEEFDRDSAARSAARLRPRGDSYHPRERPTSIVGMEGYPVPPRSARDAGPPPSSRGFDRIPYADGRKAGDDIDIGRRTSVKDYGPTRRDDDYDVPKRRASQRAPVKLHQDRDDGYTSYREEEPRHRRPRYDDDDIRDPGRHEPREARRHHKSRDEETTHTGLGTAALAAGGVAAVGAGIARARSKEPPREHDDDGDDPVRRERRDRDRDRDRRTRDVDSRDVERGEDQDGRSDKQRDRRHDPYEGDTKPRNRRSERDLVDSSDDNEDADRDRHRRHRKNRDQDGDREKEKDRGDSSSSTSDSRVDPLSKDPEREEHERRRDERHRRRQQRERSHPDDDPNIQPPFYAEEDRPRNINVVSAPSGKEPERPLKSILKTRVDPFPEDQNAIREGVAPLKEAGKKGVPQGARWTKIDRRLVNPAALEDAHERFEERPDYVIVLRVLTKEEIQGFAEKTQEIRDARYEAERRERHRRRREEEESKKKDGRQDRDRSPHSNSSSDGEYHEKKQPPLQIEAPPPQQDPRVSDPRYNPEAVNAPKVPEFV